MGSQPGGGHQTPVIDWVAVYTMLIGCIGIGLALPLKNWWIGIAGGVLLVIGGGIAIGYGIMNHTEDYEVRPKDDAGAERPATPHAHRITSA